MPTPFTRNDGLHLQLAGSDLGTLRAVGTLAGVVVLGVAARNGPGTGRLVASSASMLAWQAPGSSSPGAAVNVAGGGSYLLEDADASKWARVTVYPGYIPDTGQAPVHIQDAFNALGLGDVAAAEAAAGGTVNVTASLHNITPVTITTVKMWLDQTVGANPGISISSDNVSFFTPTSAADVNALAWASIAAGASVPVYIRRTTAAAAAANPSTLAALQFAWNG